MCNPKVTVYKRTIDGITVLVRDGWRLYRVTDATTGRHVLVEGQTPEDAYNAGYTQIFWDCAISMSCTQLIPEFKLSLIEL